MVSIKTTLKRVSDFLSFDATETPFIPLNSWHRAQEHPGVGFRIDCLAVVEGCSCGLGVWILSFVMKRVSRRVRFEAKCREPTRQYARLESVMAITRFQTGVNWHFRSFKDDVLKIEL